MSPPPAAGQSRVAALPASLACIVLAGLLAAACATPARAPASPNGATLIAGLRASAASAQSVHMAGQYEAGGATMTLDVTFAGKNSVIGTVTDGGTTIDLLVSDGNAFYKITKSMLAEVHIPVSRCAAVCGKYVLMPALVKAGLADFISLPLVMAGMLKPITADGAGLVVTATSYDGRPAYAAAEAGFRIVVSRSAGYLPLSITSAGQGSMSFSDWNSAAVPGPPAASQIVTASELAGK